MSRLSGWRYGVFITGLVGAIGITLYPIAVQPYMNPQKWKDVQKISRKQIDQASIQPAGMKVWSDPFERKK